MHDVRTHVQELLTDRPCELLDVVVMQFGRTHFVVSYIKPDAAVEGEAADQLWLDLDKTIRDHLGEAKTELIIAAQPPYASEG